MRGVHVAQDRSVDVTPQQRAHQRVERNDDIAHTTIVHNVLDDTHVFAVVVVVIVIVCVDANTIVAIAVVRQRALRRRATGDRGTAPSPLDKCRSSMAGAKMKPTTTMTTMTTTTMTTTTKMMKNGVSSRGGHVVVVVVVATVVW